jgi:hypothetical protein
VATEQDSIVPSYFYGFCTQVPPVNGITQFKTCERNMQEFNDSIKRTNLRTMGIEDGEEVQTKGIHNIFNKIITENLPNLEKTMSVQVQEASRHQTDLTKTELPHDILSLKQQAQSIEKEKCRL